VTFGELIRAIRVRQKMTISEVALQLNLSTPYVSDMERNKRNPARGYLSAWCQIIEATPEEEAELRRLAIPDVCPTCGARSAK